MLTTLCFCVRNGQVLLGKKKRGFGTGKWNGYGGKVHENETLQSGTVRELFEESGLTAMEENLERMAEIHFSFMGILRFKCHIFVLTEWRGDPHETEEMLPCWFDITGLPVNDMLSGDELWLQKILHGSKIAGCINYSVDGSIVVGSHFHPVEELC